MISVILARQEALYDLDDEIVTRMDQAHFEMDQKAAGQGSTRKKKRKLDPTVDVNEFTSSLAYVLTYQLRDSSVKEPGDQLNEKLEEFVQAENTAFEQEIIAFNEK